MPLRKQLIRNALAGFVAGLVIAASVSVAVNAGDRRTTATAEDR